MVFSTIEFLFQFLPIFLLAYYATPQKYRNITLIIGSLVFYAIGSGWYTLLLLLSLVINYGLSRLIFITYNLNHTLLIPALILSNRHTTIHSDSAHMYCRIRYVHF